MSERLGVSIFVVNYNNEPPAVADYSRILPPQ